MAQTSCGTGVLWHRRLACEVLSGDCMAEGSYVEAEEAVEGRREEKQCFQELRTS